MHGAHKYFVIFIFCLLRIASCQLSESSDDEVEVGIQSNASNIDNFLNNPILSDSSEVIQASETASKDLETSTASDEAVDNYYAEFPIVQPMINEDAINNLIYQEVQNLTNRTFYNQFVQPQVSKAVMDGSDFIINETLASSENSNIKSLDSKKLVSDSSLEIANAISDNSANLLKTDSALKSTENAASELKSSTSSASTGSYLGSIISYVSKFLSSSASSNAANVAAQNAAKAADDAAAKVAAPKLSAPAANQFTKDLGLLPKTFKPEVALAAVTTLKVPPTISIAKPTLITLTAPKPTAPLAEPTFMTITAPKPTASLAKPTLIKPTLITVTAPKPTISLDMATLAALTGSKESLLSIDLMTRTDLSLNLESLSKISSISLESLPALSANPTSRIYSVSLSLSSNEISTQFDSLDMFGSTLAAEEFATNSIIMVSDGAGLNTYEAESFFGTVYDNEPRPTSKIAAPKEESSKAMPHTEIGLEPQPAKPSSDAVQEPIEKLPAQSSQPSDAEANLVNVDGQQLKLTPSEQKAYNLVENINNVGKSKTGAAINIAGVDFTIPPDAIGKFLQYGGIGLAAFNILSVHTMTDKGTTIISTYEVPTTVTFSTSITEAPLNSNGYNGNNRYGGYYDPSAEAASIAAAAVASANSVASESKAAAEAVASNAAAAASQYYASIQSAASVSAAAEAEKSNFLAGQSASSAAVAASLYSKAQAEYSSSLAVIKASMAAAAEDLKSAQEAQHQPTIAQAIATQQPAQYVEPQAPSYVGAFPQQIPQNTAASVPQSYIYEQQPQIQKQSAVIQSSQQQIQSQEEQQQPVQQQNSIVYVYTQPNAAVPIPTNQVITQQQNSIVYEYTKAIPVAPTNQVMQQQQNSIVYVYTQPNAAVPIPTNQVITQQQNSIVYEYTQPIPVAPTNQVMQQQQNSIVYIYTQPNAAVPIPTNQVITQQQNSIAYEYAQPSPVMSTNEVIQQSQEYLQVQKQVPQQQYNGDIGYGTLTTKIVY